jgi:hypothetical protein
MYKIFRVLIAGSVQNLVLFKRGYRLTISLIYYDGDSKIVMMEEQRRVHAHVHELLFLYFESHL